MQDWKPIASAPEMRVVLLHHPYYSHGRVRQGFKWKDGTWKAVNANGTDDVLAFEPTYWAPLPETP